MPTSGTGPSRPAPARRAARGRGFTLIEVLVVLAVIAAIAGVAALSIGGIGDRELETEARRMEALLALACERAALTGRDVGMLVLDRELRFGYLVPQGFRPVEDDPADPLRPRQLDEAVRVELTRDGRTLPPAEPDAIQPQLACLSSGELTPFRLEISSTDVRDGWVLQGALDGTLTLERAHAR